MQNSILARAEDSILLLIDPFVSSANDLPAVDEARLQTSYDRLSKIADKVLVPRYFAVSAESVDDNWFSRPCERRRKRVFHRQKPAPVFSNSELLDAMRDEGRERLFVCGFWLDDVVTSTALEALVLGFDAHIIVDLCLAYDRKQRTPALDRCNQYGVVPITLLNLIYEWTANCHDVVVRQELMVHWEAQKEMERRGASA